MIPTPIREALARASHALTDCTTDAAVGIRTYIDCLLDLANHR